MSIQLKQIAALICRSLISGYSIKNRSPPKSLAPTIAQHSTSFQKRIRNSNVPIDRVWPISRLHGKLTNANFTKARFTPILDMIQT